MSSKLYRLASKLSPRIKQSPALLLSQWNNNGFILCPNLFDNEEINILKSTIEIDTKLRNNEFDVEDSSKRKSSLTLWNKIGKDTYGNFMSSPRIVNTSCYLLNSDLVYHYHTKLIYKHPKVGGEFVWHQDYGYWYQNGLLFPNLLTAFIAIDKCTKLNGCLQVLKGSHLLGRLEHNFVGEQTGINDLERIKQIEDKLEHIYVEMEEGDALFFHCNLLHRSDANESENSRLALLAAYNKLDNYEYKLHHHKSTQIDITEENDIKKYGIVPIKDESVFMDPKTDQTIKQN